MDMYLNLLCVTRLIECIVSYEAHQCELKKRIFEQWHPSLGHYSDAALNQKVEICS